MKHYKKAMLSTAIAFTTSLLLSSCGGANDNKSTTNKTTEKSANNNQKITLCMPGTFGTMEPGATTTAIDAVNIKIVYDGLIGVKKGQATLEPRLAKSWEISNDGLEYTFHLRHGVKFHTTKNFTPSRDMNADDVIFTYMRQIDKTNPYYRTKYTMISATGVSKAIKEIKKIDDYTVKFILHKPMAVFLNSQISTYVFAIVSKEYYEQMQAKGDLELAYRNPVGTGPFIFVDNHEGAYTRFKRNENYWRTSVKPSGLTLKVISDASQYLNAATTEECDITSAINSTDVKEVAKYPNLKTISLPVLGTFYLDINYKTHPEYNNPLVKHAIAYAINKQAIVDEAFQGQATVATSLVPSGMFGHIEDGLKFDFNIQKAKQLLAQAGHPNGKGLKELTYIIRAQSAESRNVALIVKSDLAKIGIKVKLSAFEWNAMIDQLMTHKYEMMALSWSADFPDPDNFYSSVLNKFGGDMNDPYWKNDQYEKLRLKSQIVSDENKRLAIYKDITKIFAKHLPIIPLVYSKSTIVVNKKIHGYNVGPMDRTDALTDVYKD